MFSSSRGVSLGSGVLKMDFVMSSILHVGIRCAAEPLKGKDKDLYIYPAPCWGEGSTPPQVFRRSKKRRRSEPLFLHTGSYILSAYVVKISDTGHSMSSHQITSRDLTSED